MGNCCLKAQNKTKKGSYNDIEMERPVKIEQPADEHSAATQASLDKWFAGAVNGKKAEENIFVQLSRLGFTDDNTLFADSSCPDEINHDDPDEDITS